MGTISWYVLGTASVLLEPDFAHSPPRLRFSHFSVPHERISHLNPLPDHNNLEENQIVMDSTCEITVYEC